MTNKLSGSHSNNEGGFMKNSKVLAAFGVGECSRCSKVEQLNWCICRECSDKAQEAYRQEVKAFAEAHK